MSRSIFSAAHFNDEVAAYDSPNDNRRDSQTDCFQPQQPGVYGGACLESLGSRGLTYAKSWMLLRTSPIRRLSDSILIP